MDAIKEKLVKLKNEQEFLGLLNEIAKEEMGDNFHPFTFQQLCFYANTDIIPSGKRYHTFKIPKKKKGEYRIISSPVKQLKIIQAKKYQLKLRALTELNGLMVSGMILKEMQHISHRANGIRITQAGGIRMKMAGIHQASGRR